MKKLLLPLVLLLVQFQVYSSNDTTKVEGVVFGRIYTGFSYSLDADNSAAGFDLTTGILGYRHKLSEKVSAILLYDVTRTTNLNSISDSSGDTVNIDYFEGSKYTAFLKMAQISWKINSKLEMSVGQLLNQQYLTLQDKWWGLRYVRVTFQEAFRYGMPADFGARLTYSPLKNLRISMNAFNGEGPFKHQDDNSKFLYSTNIEYEPLKGLLVKLYSDIEESSVTVNGEQTKSVISGFVGYKKGRLMTGIEYNYVENYRFVDGSNYTGISVYSSYKLKYGLTVFGRFDFGNLTGLNEGHYGLFGVEYEPEKNFFIAANYRHINYSSEELSPTLNVNFGIKF